MKVMILGASGATGKLLVDQLLGMGHEAKIVVRPTSSIPEIWKGNNNVEIERAHINDISAEEMSAMVKDCEAIGICLGHNISLKGMYGKPRRLVKDAVSLVSKAIALNKPESPVKMALMNTAGNSNRDINEPVSFGQKLLIGFLRLVLPPHVDNEKASDYLRLDVGQDDQFIEWTAIRPDNLLDENEVTEYELHPSPIRSALFNPGKTSRINVANFMARLVSDNELWSRWEGQMPVIYNRAMV